MKIVLYSKDKFIFEELKNITDNIYLIKDIEVLFSLMKEDEEFLFFHHLDCSDDISNIHTLVSQNFQNSKLIALRNNTDYIEACSLLKKSYKAYIHALSNSNILKDVIAAVSSGNVWVYPELMQFMINNIASQDEENRHLLDSLSSKELEVLKLVSNGLSNNEISEILDIAVVTVKKHISSLFKKLDVKDRLGLALYWKNNSL